MTNYDKSKNNHMKNSEFAQEYSDERAKVDLEYEVQSIKDKISDNDSSFNVLDALDLLQKHIVDFTHKKKLA